MLPAHVQAWPFPCLPVAAPLQPLSLPLLACTRLASASRTDAPTKRHPFPFLPAPAPCPADESEEEEEEEAEEEGDEETSGGAQARAERLALRKQVRQLEAGLRQSRRWQEQREREVARWERAAAKEALRAPGGWRKLGVPPEQLLNRLLAEGSRLKVSEKAQQQ